MKSDKELFGLAQMYVTLEKEYQKSYEYNLYDCKGNESEDKIIDYLESIDLVSEKYID